MNDDLNRSSKGVGHDPSPKLPTSGEADALHETKAEMLTETLPNGKSVALDPDVFESHRPTVGVEPEPPLKPFRSSEADNFHGIKAGIDTETLPDGKRVVLDPEDVWDDQSGNSNLPPRPRSGHLLRRAILIAVTSLLALLILLYLVSAADAYAQQLKAVNVVFLYVYIISLALLGVCLIVLVAQQGHRYRRLLSLKRLTQKLTDVEQGKRLTVAQERSLRVQLDRWLQRLRATGYVSANSYNFVMCKFQDADGVDYRVNVLQNELLPSLDDRVKMVIEKEARAVGVATALSPYGLIDAAVVLWRNGRLVLRIAEIYGGRPGGWGSLRLVRNVLGNVLFAGASQEMLNVFKTNAFAGVLSRQVGDFGKPILQGFLTGGLTIRVGLSAQEACRLIPMTEDEGKDRAAGLFSALRGILSRKSGESTTGSADSTDEASEGKP